MNDLTTQIHDALQSKVSDFHYKTWLKELVIEWDEGLKLATLVVPSKFVRDWVTDHYLPLIKQELETCLGTVECKFKVSKKDYKTPDLFALSVSNEPVNTVVAPAIGPKLNARYTFKNFVVGTNNQLAHAGAEAVAKKPGTQYNPFFIYGGVGLGKTHLLQAIAHRIRSDQPHLRVVMLTGEDFTNDVVSSIRQGTAGMLRKKYRTECDVLLIDDIQFIAGKEKTMEEFFHTFNTLYEARKQIIVTSDKKPSQLTTLDERIRSRFAWGLAVDIGLPDYETRMAILQSQAEREGISLPSDVLGLLAQNVTTSVRELEGALVRLTALASLTHQPVTLDLAKSSLASLGIIKSAALKQMTVESIQQAVASFYDVSIEELKSTQRHKSLATARQMAMYLCKQHLRVSFPEIGKRFGGKDHSTVMHSVKKIAKFSQEDPQMKQQLFSLENHLGVFQSS